VPIYGCKNSQFKTYEYSRIFSAKVCVTQELLPFDFPAPDLSQTSKTNPVLANNLAS